MSFKGATIPAEVAVTTRRLAPVAAFALALLADGTLAFAQLQSREPPPPGRRIGARDGDLIVVDHDARVGFVRRRPASVRVIYNSAERWVILLADFSTPNGEPDGFVDHNYNWRQLEGTWPLGERWEGSAILEEYTAPGFGPNSYAIVVPEGRIQFLSGGPAPTMFDDAQAIAQLRYRSGGGGTVGRFPFDRAEQEAMRNMARNAGNSSSSFSSSTFDAGGIPGGITVGGGLIATTSSQSAPPAPMDANAPVRVGGPVVMPKKTHDVAPIYPESMRQSGVSGIVILEITIERDGSIRSAKTLRGIVPEIDRAALDAAKQWKYEPVMLNGAPVPVIFTATVSVKP
jgi:TonB family protein